MNIVKKKLAGVIVLLFAFCGISSPAMAQTCIEHDIGLNQWATGPKKFTFPANIAVPPGTKQMTCVKVTGLGSTTRTFEMQRPAYEYRINNGEWLSNDTSSSFAEGDSIYLRTTVSDLKGARGDSYFKVDGVWVGAWKWQTENTGRAPIIWKVGPTRTDTQLVDIQDQLVAGDVVELDGDATYEAVEFTRSGTAELPIVIRGVLVNGKRPVISGNLPPASWGAKDWTVSFAQSHYYEVENVEITGARSICVRHEAHQITIRNSYIHHCDGMGVMGTDENSGTMTLSHVEIAWAGRARAGRHVEHPVYVATDPHQFPDSMLRVEHSYIHDYRGNAIKSRANRTELLFNWIEQSEWVNPDDATDKSYYSIELNGQEAYEPDKPIESIVMGNVLELKVNTHLFGVRVGGDGTGYSLGRVWFASNVIISPPDEQPYSHIFMLYSRLNSLYMKNNLFIRADEVASEWRPVRLFRDEISVWHSDGEELVYGENNWYPSGTMIGMPTDLTSSIFTQWNAENETAESAVSGIAYDSASGILTLPSENTLLTSSDGLHSSLDPRYVPSGLIEYEGQPYRVPLIRPVKGVLGHFTNPPRPN